MKTISAKQLRDNLDSIVQRVRLGEAISVTYRSKPAFTLQPVPISGPQPGSKEAMIEFVKSINELNKTPRKSELDPTKSIKQLHHELLDADPKYKGDYAQ